jgi:translation initiation factor IF-2
LAKAIRVFELAKELGVKSKVIVEKCQAEDVPGVTNHMSTVKIGLAETVRQWFGVQANVNVGGTAVETAEKVDMPKVKKVSRKKNKAAGSREGDQESGGVAVQEQEADPTPASPPRPVIHAAPDKPADSPSGAESVQRVATKKVKPKSATQVGELNVPDRPQVVEPVGERLETPKKPDMKGPRVVRIEKPEPADVRMPRSRQPRSDGSAPPEAPGSVPGISRSPGPARGRGAGSAKPDSPAAEGRRRRMVNTRRGRSADALPTGPSNFSQADLENLDQILKGNATGYMKQRRRDLRKQGQGGQAAQAAVVTGGKVEVSEPITIKGFSAATGIKTNDIMRFLFKQGVMATINSAISNEAATEVAMEYNIGLEVKPRVTAEQTLLKQFEDREAIRVGPRPPVVTIMGHVDHGKTSLLDQIRQADVAAHESGGITQHVGAYRVTVVAGDGQEKTVVFMDTPGHAAFTSMRARGAKMTDLVVLVVAADDGVMPQTIESINHAKAAGVPIIVALNKIDMPQATDENIRKIFGQLAEQELNPTEWGGQTEVVRTSAETGQGISDLVEVLDYQSELLELTADYGGAARGTVIETQMQPGRGAVARVLVQQGRLQVGDNINIGRAFGRVREMTDDRGRPIREAEPATPLELSGINVLPNVSDKFYVTGSLKQAEGIAQQYREDERQQLLASQTKVTLDTFAATVAAGQTQELRVVLKADVQGSVDVLQKSLEGLGNQEVAIKVLHAAVGAISESDVVLADASEAVIIGFHVTILPAVREIAESKGVDVRLYRVIYEATDELKKALEGMLEPEQKEEQVGTAEVKKMFKISKLGMVAGCLVTEGLIDKSARARIVRDGVVVTEDRAIESLRRVKDDAVQVRTGTECGIRLGGFDDVKPGDLIICYNVTEVKRTLD